MSNEILVLVVAQVVVLGIYLWIRRSIRAGRPRDE